MRNRHLLILLMLAALPVVLAIVLTAGHGSRANGGSAAQVSLDLQGGASASGVSACGTVHHYTVFGSGGTITFRGTISPATRSAVKIKLRSCTGGVFRDSGEATATEHSGGTYKGSFPAPIGGYYFARAEVKQGGALVARSEKRYFEVR